MIKTRGKDKRIEVKKSNSAGTSKVRVIRPVRLRISTDKLAYVTGIDSITLTWENMTTNLNDWWVVAPAGSGPESYVLHGAYNVVWAYTDGVKNGSHTIPNINPAVLPPGTYVARLYTNDTFNLAAESVPFVIQ